MVKDKLRSDIHMLLPDEIFGDEAKHQRIDECVLQGLSEVRDMHHIDVDRDGKCVGGCFRDESCVYHAVGVEVLAITNTDEIVV
jgi:hypothetical protein